jgi:hypothetical protein
LDWVLRASGVLAELGRIDQATLQTVIKQLEKDKQATGRKSE